MESRGYQNLYPDLSPTKEDVSSFSENKESNDEEEAFCRDLQKAKALSLITAQQEERQRQLDKAMINSSNGSSVVPILKPPPRQPRQYFDGSSEVSKGLARPKPAANPPTGETSNNAWTSQASNLLNVDAAQRSHSVPPFFKNDDSVDTLNVDSNRELIQLSPAVSDRSSNVDFDVRQLDPLYSGSYRGASVNTSNVHNLTIPKSSESSNAIATVPRKNFSFTSGEEIGRLSQTNPGGPFYGFMPIPVDHKQIPPPLPAKAPRGQWRDPWGPAPQNVFSNNLDRSFPDINKPVLPPRITYPPAAPTRLSLKTQGYHPPLYGFEAHMLPSPITSNNFLSFANNNVPFIRYGSNDALTFGQQLDKQTSDPLICSSERQTLNDNFEVDEANNVELDVNGDLIHFPDNAESTQISNPTYMSLADFDPLFEMKSKTSQTAKTSEDGSRKSVKAPPICPRRKVTSLPSASSEDNTLQYPNAGSQQRISVIPASWSFSPETSFDRAEVCTFRERETSQKCFDFDWEDPNDPFSLCHLVRRSQKYQQQQQLQQQQQQQQQQLWHKNDSVTSIQRKQLSCLDNSSQPPAVEPRKVVMRNHSETKYSEEFLEETPETADEEIRAFLQMVARIKLQHPIGDQTANSGIVISPQTAHKQYINLTVKVIVLGQFVPNEVVFVCDVNSTVEHVIIQVLMILIDDKNVSPDAYVLKVFGYSEYLINKSLLSDYEYVQKCLKLGKDIKLIIEETEYIQRPFLRTIEDINHPVYVPKMLSTDDASSKLTMNKINILLETFYKECEKLKTSVSQAKQKITCLGVVQSVKAICMMLNNIQTVDVTKAVKRLKSLLAETENTHSPNGSCGAVRDVCIYEPEDSPILAGISRQYSDVTRRCIMTTDFLDDLQKSLSELSRSVKNLIDMFCRTFHKEFRFKSFVAGHKETCDISTLNECLLVHLAAAHRIPNSWRNVHSEFYVQCRIFNGGHQVGREAWTQAIQLPQSGDQNTLVWDEWLTFDEVRICDLPREAKLCFNLIGCRMAQNSTNEGQTRIRRNLAWVAIQLFNHQFELVQGDHLLGMWSGTCQAIAPTTDTNTHGANSLLLQMSLQNFDFVCLFPKIEEMSSAKQDFDTLHPDDQSLLTSFIDKDPIVRLSEEEKEFLWQKRHYLYGYPSALPKVLQTITSWAWYSLSETYTMVRDWSPLSPMQSLQLLLPRFSDTIVRCIAVDKLRELPADDFCDLLPQLIQALKFEFYHTSALARLLLERSATSVRVAHQIYWLLKDAADDVHHKKRYQLMFGALMSVVGEKMRQEFGKQEELVNMLSSIADKVKAAKDRDAVLQRELCNMWDFLQHKSVRLPTNPGLEIAGVDVKSCSFFTSFTVPLKLAFRNVDSSAGDIYVMFKAGDDLRQDALTLQMIRIMDRLWLQGGLELKMVTFKCLPTSPKKGFVELIPESDTLGKIQKKHGHGVTGSFKDRPIAEWLQMHNPSELDYQAAVDNFTASCAGYCVATYILGVCDRHNDNIMIKHSGHIFHIDYAKFLGDLQMLGAINRDRTPFILTSDMAYVINGGDKPTEKFQKFVDLCCHALNIVRRNSGLFINLFSLMTLSGIPRVNENAPRYVREAMMPERSDAEAVAEFTRMVNTSLKSIFTQFNFFIHNLAQLKFSGHDEGMLLSFVPKTYSINTDGRIKNLELHGIQKRYNPEKFYIFIVKVERVNQKVPNLVLRRFSEFQELHRKLVATFPLVQWPSLSGKIILGRAHVKAVAESRKAELEVFLKSLLKMSAEVAEHDLIYTFFHPMLRDEQENKTNLLKLKDLPPSPALPASKYLRNIEGFIKLSIFHKMHGLTVMVMHVKDLGKNSSGELPSPYVKLYLLPDPMKLTKRKTKIAKNTSHPTYNEMLIYRMPLEVASQKVLQVTVWSYDGLKENEFLGGVHVRLGEIDLTRESVGWHKLLPLYVLNMSST